MKISERKRKWWVLAAMASCISMIFLDQSVLPVALPTINRELHISELGMQWIINAYLLALTTFVLAGGRLGDMLGHRKIFTIGLIIFSLSSALCGLSQSTAWFITSRLLQGVGGALMIPTAPGMLTPAFPPEQRGRAFGFYVGIGAFFLSLGPIVGGLFTQYLTWRYVFWINLPIAAIGLCLTFLSVPKSEKKDESFDYLGFFTIAIGISCIIVGLMQGETWGWFWWPVPTLIFTGVFLILALAFFDRDVKDPFLDFKLLRDPRFMSGSLTMFAIQLVLILTIFWAIYFQNVLGYSPSVAGFWAMIANSPVIFFSHISGYLNDRFGPKPSIIIGFCLVIIGISWFVLTPTPSSPLWLLPLIIPFGCGVPMILLPSFMLSLSTVSAEKRGVAVGIYSTFRQFGATLGMAIFGQIFLLFQNKSFGKTLLLNPSTAQLQPEAFEGLLSRAEPATTLLNSLPTSVAEKVHTNYVSTYISSTTALNLLGIAIAVGGLLCACFLIKKGKHPI